MTSRPDAADPLTALDERLAALGQALRGRDANEVAAAADALRSALEAAVLAMRRPGAVMTPALRRHLTIAVGRLAAQREALARATASVDRAIDVLMPAGFATPATYAASGFAQRAQPAGPALRA